MTTPDPVTTFDLLVLPSFLDAATCKEIIADMLSSTAAQATVYESDAIGSVNERVRKAIRHTPSTKTVEYINQRLWECKPAVEDHFKVSLTECDPPQFLHYRVGDFFVAHQDGNTGLIRSDTEARRVSVIILLTEQSAEPAEEKYCGGSLTFHEWRHGQGSAELPQPQAGTFVAFRAETTHEVTPVTHGERFSIACWYR